MNPKPLHLESRCIHGGQRPDPTTGAVMPPIYTSSTFIQESPGVHKGFEYSRSHNVTRFALERCLANLESTGLTEEEDRTQGGFAFASGLAAIATCLELLDAGQTVMCMDDVYGGTNRLLQRVRQRSQGLKVVFVDMSDTAALERQTASASLLFSSHTIDLNPPVWCPTISRGINAEDLCRCTDRRIKCWLALTHRNRVRPEHTLGLQ